MREFGGLLEARWKLDRYVCVGLDVNLERLPAAVPGATDAARCLEFARRIVEATKEYVAAYKPNLSFFEALGGEGFHCLRDVIRYINSVAPEVPVIADAKRGDISSTNDGYVSAVFEYLGADAITLHPYLGREALKPFLDRSDKGCFILCRTSNPGAAELQDLEVMGEPLYLRVARLVGNEWNENGNCGLVTGATYPEEVKLIRERVPQLPLLIPGVGAQGGSVERTIRAATTNGSLRAVINSSREIIFASSGTDYADRALDKTVQLHNDIMETIGNLRSSQHV